MLSLQNDPVWLPTKVIVDINIATVQETGESYALLFPEKLEGALMRPQNLFAYEEPDAVGLAVSYMEAIAMAHAFEQGNKRTGFDAGFIFLNLNGWEIHPDADNELTAVAFLELIEKTITTGDFEAYLADFVIPTTIDYNS